LKFQAENLLLPFEQDARFAPQECEIIGEQNISLPVMRIEKQLLGCPARRLDSVISELPGSTMILVIVIAII
jgi:hypothetical protein